MKPLGMDISCPLSSSHHGARKSHLAGEFTSSIGADSGASSRWRFRSGSSAMFPEMIGLKSDARDTIDCLKINTGSSYVVLLENRLHSRCGDKTKSKRTSSRAFHDGVQRHSVASDMDEAAEHSVLPHPFPYRLTKHELVHNNFKVLPV